MSEAAQVAEPETVDEVKQQPKPEDKQKSKRQPRYHVVLWNDDDHSYEYVVRMLKELFGHPDLKGLKLAQEVDLQGRTVVLTTTKEHAELKRDQIHAYGKDALIASSKGSMSSSIEPES
ncbi:MAG: ATP-dependent Clp protease adaptor ClpS [Planctomycetes bacterium]|nr:ATP-dependent Clp protease adaptor ClpS [Planctomycetota bacterium]